MIFLITILIIILISYLIHRDYLIKIKKYKENPEKHNFHPEIKGHINQTCRKINVDIYKKAFKNIHLDEDEIDGIIRILEEDR